MNASTRANTWALVNDSSKFSLAAGSKFSLPASHEYIRGGTNFGFIGKEKLFSTESTHYQKVANWMRGIGFYEIGVVTGLRNSFPIFIQAFNL